MGEGTFVNEPIFRKAAGALRRARSNVDFILISVTAALVLFGLLMVYSAGPYYAALEDKSADYYLLRQMLWAGMGVVAIVFFWFFPYQWFQRITVPMMGVTIAMLFLVAILADTTLGANRSIVRGSVRPSELAKIVMIIYVSAWLYAKREVLNDLSFGLIPLTVILGVLGGLIFLQPDFSAAATVVLMGAILFFLAGGAWRQIALTIFVAAILGWLVVTVYPTGQARVASFFSGLQNPLNADYHVRRSLEAVINGGFFGVGIGHSSTKFTGLPVGHTDSIFAIVAEETGLLGVGLLILAYLTLLWRGLTIARNAPDKFGQLLAGGISIWILVEAFLNMAVMVSLLPNAGNALPFISYGGSHLLVTMAGIGILLNIGKQGQMGKSQSQGGNGFASVVDLRWRNGGRRVSRSVRPSSSR